jgi:hypothetical protein
MSKNNHLPYLRRSLAQGPRTARELADSLGVSQPTVSRLLAELGSEVIRLGAARSARYALRDALRGLPDMTVYRVNAQAKVEHLGRLVPVRPAGFVMHALGGASSHTDGLPWCLFDMRPQGYLGRAFALRHGASLGLPPGLSEWTDAHALRAMLAHGHDMVGDVLLGDWARERFLAQTVTPALGKADKAAAYVRLSQEASRGELPDSSAAGEQPKFMAWSLVDQVPCHVLVKFSEPEDSPVSERWRDLLLAEHLALQTLNHAGLPASRTQVVDAGGQRFLEVLRFDRVGALGRRGLISLAALDAQFVGAGPGENNWPRLALRLLQERHLQADAVQGAQLLWAFGTLIGNTDMHNGNLSFITEPGRPCTLAPAYDVTPMAFAPRSGGGLPNDLPAARLDAAVPAALWHQALPWAELYVHKLAQEPGLSPRFAACVAALQRHVLEAAGRVGRLA